MPPKRKLNSMEEDDVEAPAPGNRVLPVANLPDNFNGEPEDGAQYLFMVRRDALNLPHITRVSNPYETKDVAPANPVRKPPHPSIPSEEWRSSFEDSFNSFRQSWKTNKASQPAVGLDNQTPKVPRYKDRDGWLLFLNGSGKPAKKATQVEFPPSTAFAPRSVLGAKFGVPMAPQTQSNNSAVSNIQEAGIIDDEEPEIPIKEECEEESTSSEPRKPVPSIIKNMDDNGTIHLLMFIAHWMRKSLENISSSMPSLPLTRPFYFPRHHQQWAFALLAQLDTSLRSEEISHLREVARACIATIREDLDLDGPVEIEVGSGVSPMMATTAVKLEPSRYAHLTGTWMVIGAIASVWGQRDMWQDAEEALSDLVIVKPQYLVPKTSSPMTRSIITSHGISSHLSDLDLDVVLNYG